MEIALWLLIVGIGVVISLRVDRIAVERWRQLWIILSTGWVILALGIFVAALQVPGPIDYVWLAEFIFLPPLLLYLSALGLVRLSRRRDRLNSENSTESEGRDRRNG